ncbi:MAG TPA: trypsin-like peptidase domain-containing protein, partial [Marmoricola sp.]|nr:trypsin-like peptidase domain-containing protein [Marmoricola sp.]
ATRDSIGTTAGSTPTLQIPPRTAAPLPADNSSVPAVAAKVLPSTVQIVAEFQGENNGATGSGWVYDDKGHIVTNNHVIESAANDGGPIKIIDNEGNHYSAKVVGRSAVYDLAVLEAPQARDLTPLAMGASQDMRVGETVIAVGSPLGLSASVTSGIVSALQRPVSTGNGGDSNSYINAVQTDAAINPGNSGGPLVNLQGQVIGVNSAIASMGGGITGDQSGNIGVGFAIPSEQVVTTVTQIISTGRAEFPVIGAGVRGTSGMNGAVITNVEAGMPAARAGLKAEDVVRRINGRPVTSSIDLVVAIRSHVAGDVVTLTVERGGKAQEIKVRLAAKEG